MSTFTIHSSPSGESQLSLNGTKLIEGESEDDYYVSQEQLRGVPVADCPRDIELLVFENTNKDGFEFDEHFSIRVVGPEHAYIKYHTEWEHDPSFFPSEFPIYMMSGLPIEIQKNLLIQLFGDVLEYVQSTYYPIQARIGLEVKIRATGKLFDDLIAQILEILRRTDVYAEPNTPKNWTDLKRRLDVPSEKDTTPDKE